MIIIPEHVSDHSYARGLWITEYEFRFFWMSRWYYIPAGMVLDFYSIPRFLWWWRPPRHGKGDEAALIHDFLCRFHKLLGITRNQADLAFLDAMRYYDMPYAELKYRTVKLFGPLTDCGGEGNPGSKVRRAMRRNGDDWREYAKLVEQTNKGV